MPAKTRLISIRDFRANLTRLLKESQEDGVHFVVMRHATPVAQVTPVPPDASLEQLAQDIKRARQDYRKGRVYSAAAVLAKIAAR